MFLLFLALVAVACMGRRHRARHWSAGWQRPDWRRHSESSEEEADGPSVRERFEAWHRATHAGTRSDGDPDDTHYV